MGYAEKRQNLYIGRYNADGAWPTVKDDQGATIRFRTRREAVAAANDIEAKIRAGRWRDPASGQITFGAWVNQWYAALDLAKSTMQNYKHHLEEHLLPEFEDSPLAAISGAAVDRWERSERAAGYSLASVKTWRSTLSTVLADAAAEDLITANPAVKRRGRGKRAGRSRARGPEKVTTDALGALLIGERAALLSGRDDEFVAVTLMYWTGLRWGELVGLENTYARAGVVRVEWQLWEDDTGSFHRLPPKDDSYRDIDAPAWLSDLVSSHLAHTTPKPCACHGHRYVFAGLKSTHPRRSSFSDWIFDPAVSGWFPTRGHRTPRRPVSVEAEPWPGTALRGRGNGARATACWMPIAPGLTPHGLRHSHKTLLVQMRVPEILSHERLGHELGGIGGRYSHITPAMRHDLLDGLTEHWDAALAARREMNPTSPVPILDNLLSTRQRETSTDGHDTDHAATGRPGNALTLRSKPHARRKAG